MSLRGMSDDQIEKAYEQTQVPHWELKDEYERRGLGDSDDDQSSGVGSSFSGGIRNIILGIVAAVLLILPITSFIITFTQVYSLLVYIGYFLSATLMYISGGMNKVTNLIFRLANMLVVTQLYGLVVSIIGQGDAFNEVFGEKGLLGKILLVGLYIGIMIYVPSYLNKQLTAFIIKWKESKANKGNKGNKEIMNEDSKTI
jgi:hypothetical protein